MSRFHLYLRVIDKGCAGLPFGPLLPFLGHPGEGNLR